jgi:KTSC domain
MHRVPVELSMLDSIGFEKNVLEVRFCNGGLYQYLDVPEPVLSELMRAESKGRFFNQHIRGRYPSVRLERQAAPMRATPSRS